MQSKEETRRKDLNKAVLPLALLTLSLFLPVILVVLQIKKIMPTLFVGKLYLVSIVLPSIFLNFLVFIIARNYSVAESTA